MINSEKKKHKKQNSQINNTEYQETKTKQSQQQ